MPGGTSRTEAARGWNRPTTSFPPTDCSSRDAQTSGGLLFLGGVPPENEPALVEALRAAGTPAAAVIGRLTDGPAGAVQVMPARLIVPAGPLPGPAILLSMASFRWTADRMDQLERAARDRLRVTLTRRGTEYVVTALRLTTVDRRDALVGRLPMTGDEITLRLDEVDSFQVVG